MKKNVKKEDRSSLTAKTILGGLIAAPLAIAVGGLSLIRGVFYASKIRTIENPGEHIINIYNSKFHLFRLIALDEALRKLENYPEQFKKALTILTEKEHKDGIKSMLEHITNIDFHHRSTDQRAQHHYSDKISLTQYINFFKETHQKAIKNGNQEIIALIESGINRLESKAKNLQVFLEEHINKIANIGNTHSINDPNLLQSTIISQGSITAQIDNSSNVGAQSSTNPIMISQSISSITNDTNFAINSVIASAIVLKMLGMDKFTKFAFPPTPIQITRDYELPTNDWTPNEFKELLHKNPKAEIIAKAVENKMKKDKSISWSPQQTTEFVQSSAFEKLLKATKEAEKTARKTTQKDFEMDESLLSKKYEPKQKSTRLRGRRK